MVPDAVDPAARIGEHSICFNDIPLFDVGTSAGDGGHFIDLSAQLADRVIKFGELQLRIIRHRVREDNARFVKQNMALRQTLLSNSTLEFHRPCVRCRHRLVVGDERAEFGHVRKEHCHDLDDDDLVLTAEARLPGLNHQYAERFAQPLKRNPEK